jgi:hypothetical protein
LISKVEVTAFPYAVVKKMKLRANDSSEKRTAPPEFLMQTYIKAWKK